MYEFTAFIANIVGIQVVFRGFSMNSIEFLRRDFIWWINYKFTVFREITLNSPSFSRIYYEFTFLSRIKYEFSLFFADSRSITRIYYEFTIYSGS